MYGELQTTIALTEQRQNQLLQEAESHRLARHINGSRQPVYGSLLAGIGSWMASTGEQLQQRYSQSIELANEPSADCA
jgi:hypothetical protein